MPSEGVTRVSRGVAPPLGTVSVGSLPERMPERMPEMNRSTWMAMLCVSVVVGVVRAGTMSDALDGLEGRGGLVVHLGCGRSPEGAGPGQRTVGLGAQAGVVVHGLDVDAGLVARAREHIIAQGRYGPVSVDRFDGVRLPSADGQVRVLVVDRPFSVGEAEMLRVLCPGGTALLPDGAGWRELRRPRSAELDVWSQHLHGADGNPVSDDARVGPPRRVQWMAGPKYSRTHAKDPSLHLMLATADRVFYNLDEGPIGVIDSRLEERWSLMARDAYSGVLLWTRRLDKWDFRHWEKLSEAMGPRAYRTHPSNWSAPLTLRRRVVADANAATGRATRLLATLRYPDALVEELDPATGKTRRVFEQTRGTDEMVLAGGVLVLRRRSFPGNTDRPLRELTDLPPEKVTGVDVETGKTLWEVSSEQLAPLTLAARDGRVCFRTFEQLLCLDLSEGRELWRADCAASPASKYDVGSGGALVMWEDLVLVSRIGKGVRAYRLVDGEMVWENRRLGAGGLGFMGVMSLLVADGAIWQTPAGTGYDPRTGRKSRSLDLGAMFQTGHHVRCYREKATQRYIIYPRRGLEFVDLAGGNHSRNDWTRGACGFGILPANGLLYAPPHPCHCYSGSMVPGLNAFASADRKAIRPGPSHRTLEKGPAYQPGRARGDARADAQEPAAAPDESDWPMYRRDARRSGATASPVPLDASKAWATKLDGAITPPVAAGGRVFVAEIDRHGICCLDAKTGDVLWRYTTGGPIDSPPTIHAGRVFFGSADGWVYALRASDGKPAWRFHAAPDERRAMILGRLESAWPVHGSVLVRDGRVYCTAGRSSYLDGGIYVYALDVATGKVLYEDRLDGPWVDATKTPGQGHYLQGPISDLLVEDERGGLNMVHIRWDGELRRERNPLLGRQEVEAINEAIRAGRRWGKPRDPNTFRSYSGLRSIPRRVLATNGFLEDADNPRTYWFYGDYWPGFNNAAPDAPAAGRTVCVDDRRVYAARVYRNSGNQSRYFRAGDGTVVSADPRERKTPVDLVMTGQPSAFVRTDPPVWSVTVPIRVVAMIATGNGLVVAGPPDVVPEGDTLAAFEGRAGGRLLVLDKTTGEPRSQLDLPAPPVFNGQCAAHGRLFVSLENGTLVCVGE